MATTLKELIEDIEKDDLPTNEFTIEDEDPMVILGKINEVIASLKMIQDTISSSDTKAQEALTTAIQSLDTANQALSSSNISLETANQAIATANQAIASANTALQESQNAVDTSNQANNTANTAETNSLEAIRIAQEALDQVVQDLGTKAYINGVLQNRLDFTEDPQTQLNNILSQVETNTSDISTLTSDVEELGNEINTTNSNLNTINSNLNTETTARENADSNLQQQITTNLNKLITEITNRENADSNLQSQITNILNNINTLLSRAYIVETGNNANGYFAKWSNGIQICYNTTPNTTSSGVITTTLPSSFINTNYVVPGTIFYNGTNWTNYAVVMSKTTTNFRWYKYASVSAGFTYIAIGYWK